MEEYAGKTLFSAHDSQYEYDIQIAILKFPTVLTRRLDS